jgi:hypothetical protein
MVYCTTVFSIGSGIHKEVLDKRRRLSPGKYDQVSSPSKTIVMADTKESSTSGFYVLSNVSNYPKIFSGRHNASDDILFTDGHAANFRTDRLLNWLYNKMPRNCVPLSPYLKGELELE